MGAACWRERGDHDTALRPGIGGVGSGNRELARRGNLVRLVPTMFFSDAGGVDVACFVDGQGGDFFFRRAVEDEAFSAGRDSIDQSAAVRTGNQIAFAIEGHHANMGFVTFEKDRVLALRSDAEYLSVIPGGHVEIAAIVEGEIPNVFGAGLEIN